MAGDFEALFQVAACVAFSTTYARFAAASTDPGCLRFVSILPVVLLFLYLPWLFSSIHLRAISSFFLAWLGLFKLLLLSFGSAGPLSPSLPPLTFVATSSLPVKPRGPRPKPSAAAATSNLLLPYCIKAVLLCLLIPLYRYKPRYHLLLLMYCFHVYLMLEIVLASAAFLAGSLIGLELEPQFDAPLKSTSLQDFWGRRWNLMVTSVLRPSVYYPVRSRFGTAAGVVAVFLVSGIMHEFVFYYVTLEGPTGEVTLFFLIHGLCTAAEVRVKRWWGRRWRPLPAAAGTAATLGFVAGTGFWLFFPPIVRGDADERTIEECLSAVSFVRDVVRGRW